MTEPDWQAMGDPLNDRLPPKDNLLNRRRRKDLARIVGPRTLDGENICTRCGVPDVHCQCDDRINYAAQLSDDQVAWYAGTSRTAKWTPDMSTHENIVALAREVQEARAKLAAIDALHSPHPRSPLYCATCDAWPCPTQLALHPEGDSPNGV